MCTRYVIRILLSGGEMLALSPIRFPTSLTAGRWKVHLCDVLLTSTHQQMPSFTFTNRGIKRDSSKINRTTPGFFTTVELLLALLTVALATLCHCVRFITSFCLSSAHLFSGLHQRLNVSCQTEKDNALVSPFIEKVSSLCTLCLFNID